MTSRFNLLFLVFALAPLRIAASTFPPGILQFSGSEKTDIIHCLQEDPRRQFCKVGWGKAFDRLKVIRQTAPEAYGAQILLPDSKVTPVGPLRAEEVIETLATDLFTKYRITPELSFLVDWSRHADCWQHGPLQLSLQVFAMGNKVGTITPGVNTYSFPITTPTDLRFWQVIRQGEMKTERASWDKPNTVALQTEFDFSSTEQLGEGFSSQVLPKVCTIKMSGVQIILNRETVTTAVALMTQSSRYLLSQMTTLSLLYAREKRSAESVKCLLSSQANSLRAAEGKNNRPISDLSAKSQEALRESMELTTEFTGVLSANQDPLEYLEKQIPAWEQACASDASEDILAQMRDAVRTSSNEAARQYLKAHDELGTLLKEAWSLAIVLEAVNESNRELQWLIDSTVDYRLEEKP